MKVVRLPRPARAFIEQQNSVNTKAAYHADLSKWALFAVNKPFTVDTATAFKTHLLSTYAPATARRVFGTVRTYFDWMRRQGKIEHNPFDVVKGPQVTSNASPKVPTDLDVARILKQVNRWGSRLGARDFAILALLLNGLRAQEVCDLRYCDYMFMQGAWCVRVIGKGNKERIVPVSTESQEAIEYYMDTTFKPGVSARGEREQPMFFDIMGEPLTRHQVAFICRKYGEAAGVKGFTPHSFRHHYGTRMYRVTRDVLGVGRLLGHSKPETTQVYARLDLADLVETARLDPRNTVDDKVYDASKPA